MICLVISFCLGKRDEVAAVHETYFGGELLAALTHAQLKRCAKGEKKKERALFETETEDLFHGWGLC